MKITGKFHAVTEHFGDTWSSQVLRMMLQLNVIAAAHFGAGDADGSSSDAVNGLKITSVVSAVRTAMGFNVSRAIT
jgi:hypothetical protein